ncbi:retrovirus-related pol polyprotein from transposon TNT 1-94 [Tanacetum coccineum]|uniref:Retrovirus-related pol polyprotein from transposon TNT 1-94 n=1 Tax=Tanacetum coccineum TaxID=301880 RepID=A0ABQ5B7E5_9ASTR
MDDMIRMKNINFTTFEMEIDTLKHTLSKHVKEKESLLTTLNGFKTEFKQRKSKTIDKEIVLENKNKELEDIVYFRNHFVPQQDLSVEQMFWLQSSNKKSEEPSTSNTPVKIEVPSELPKNDDSVGICNKCLELEAEFVKKNNVYIELSKRFSNLEQHCISLEVAMQLNQEIFQKDKSCDNQSKNVLDNATTITNATTIAPRMFKLDIESVFHRLKKNRDAYEDYLKKTIENTDTIPGLELLVYVSKTCLSLTKPREKLVVVTPKNKDKKVRFVDRITSSSNTQKQVDSYNTQDSNKPLLHSTGLICSTGASGSKPTCNTKNNRISQPSSNNKINKVENQSRSVKSRTILKLNVVQIVLWYLDSRCSKHMTENRSPLTNFVNKFLGTVKFGNDQIAKIMGYSDYQIKNVTISRVYYVEGLGHNLFSVGQFCDSNLEVAFRKHTCFDCNLEGVDLLTGSRRNNLYTLSNGDMMKSSLICLLSKASKTKSWLWHQCLSHLNFGTINQLAKQGLVRGSYDWSIRSLINIGSSLISTHLLYMDLCGLMRVESINEKKYILVIVDDYSWFTWVKFLRSKDEALEFIINFLKLIQVRLNTTVRNIHTDNEAVATACYTQNRSLIRLCYEKTPYELLHDRKLDISYLHVFGALYYPTNDNEDLGKLKAKADVGIFIGYAPTKKAYRIYIYNTPIFDI